VSNLSEHVKYRCSENTDLFQTNEKNKTKLFFSSLHGADDKLVVDKETTKSQITPQATVTAINFPPCSDAVGWVTERAPGS